jgi:hypothetical protein
MTKDEALQLALEALDSSRIFVVTKEKLKHPEGVDWYDEAITAIKKALETKDEPVGWIDNKGNMICTKINESCRPLYTTSQRTWIGLTDEEKAQFVVAYYPSNWDRKTAVSLMNDYEKYLKEKNHG